MEHPIQGTILRYMMAICKCKEGAVVAIVTDEETIIRTMHMDGDVEHAEEVSLPPDSAAQLAFDMLRPVLYGTPN